MHKTNSSSKRIEKNPSTKRGKSKEKREPIKFNYWTKGKKTHFKKHTATFKPTRITSRSRKKTLARDYKVIVFEELEKASKSNRLTLKEINSYNVFTSLMQPQKGSKKNLDINFSSFRKTKGFHGYARFTVLVKILLDAERKFMDLQNKKRLDFWDMGMLSTFLNEDYKFKESKGYLIGIFRELIQGLITKERKMLEEIVGVYNFGKRNHRLIKKWKLTLALSDALIGLSHEQEKRLNNKSSKYTKKEKRRIRNCLKYLIGYFRVQAHTRTYGLLIKSLGNNNKKLFETILENYRKHKACFEHNLENQKMSNIWMDKNFAGSDLTIDEGGFMHTWSLTQERGSLAILKKIQANSIVFEKAAEELAKHKEYMINGLIYGNNIEALKILIKDYKIDIDKMNLIYSCIRGSLPVIELLTSSYLKKESSTDSSHFMGHLVYTTAKSMVCHEAIEYLVKKCGADVNYRHSQRQDTPLMVVISRILRIPAWKGFHNAYSKLETLIKLGAAPNMTWPGKYSTIIEHLKEKVNQLEEESGIHSYGWCKWRREGKMGYQYRNNPLVKQENIRRIINLIDKLRLKNEKE